MCYFLNRSVIMNRITANTMGVRVISARSDIICCIGVFILAAVSAACMHVAFGPERQLYF